MYKVTSFPHEFQVYLTTYLSVTANPDKQGLLSSDSNICQACRLVLERKFSAFERNAIPYTPKKGRKSVTEQKDTEETDSGSGTKYDMMETQADPSAEKEHEAEPEAASHEGLNLELSSETQLADPTTSSMEETQISQENITQRRAELHFSEQDDAVPSTSKAFEKDPQNATFDSDMQESTLEETHPSQEGTQTPIAHGQGPISLSPDDHSPSPPKKEPESPPEKVCVACKKECNPKSHIKSHRSFRVYHPSPSKSERTLIHIKCRDRKWTTEQMEQWQSTKTPVEIAQEQAQEQAVDEALHFAKDKILERKEPVLFKDIYQCYETHYHDFIDPDVEDSWNEHDAMSFVRNRVNRLQTSEKNMKFHKGTSSRMYYHAETDFIAWSHNQLDRRETVFPQNSGYAQQQYAKTFPKGPSDYVAMHNCLKMLRNALEEGSDVCQFYGTYPDLLTSLNQEELMTTGKTVKAKTPQESNSAPQHLEVLIPPFPPLLLNFLKALCARKHSSLEKKFEEGKLSF